MNQNPERVFRIGCVSASVFAREIRSEGRPERTLRSVSFQKRYVSGEEVKFSGSFGLAELPALSRVAQLAQEYIESKEICVS